MQVVNFLYPEKSDIRYKIHNFPDGQQHLEILSPLDNRKNVVVYARLSCLNDIWILLQLNDICQRQGLIIQYVYITYLFAARTDRVFSAQEALDLDIVINMLKSIKAEFEIFEPHSFDRVIYSGIRAYRKFNSEIPKTGIIIFPDRGAKQRYGMIIDGKYFCEKRRRLGGITISVPEITETQGPFYVVDDLCDGGGTFFKLYEQLPEHVQQDIHLIVAHAIQKSALNELAKLYKTITISNSYKAWELESDLRENIRVIKLYDF